LTGSVSAGAQIASLAGKNIKKIVLELGGSDPHIVLQDADIEKAAQGAVLGRTLNGGQVCIGSKRILVHNTIAQEFSQRFADLMSQLKVGDPSNPQTQMGPLASKKAVEEMQSFVADAVSKGATILTGGKPVKHKGFFFQPTVITNTSPKMNAVCQEIFGPIAPIITFETDQQAIDIANSSEFGLSASIWSTNTQRAQSIARKLAAGGVFINSISQSHPLIPLGGIKKSGYGRELSEYGIKEFVNIKSINIY